MRSKESIAKAVRCKTEIVAHKRMFAHCEGMCGDASIALKNSLKSYGYEAKAFYGRFIGGGRSLPHCWVETDDEVIDITATQFSGINTTVFRIRKDSKDYKKLYHRVDEIKSVKEVSDNFTYSKLIVRRKNA